MKVSQAVAERVNELLLKKGITKYRLEKNMAIPHNTMISIFRGDTDGINLKTVMLMIKGLGISAAEFFDDPRFDYDNLDI